MSKKKIEYRIESIWGKTPILILAHVTGNELKAYVALSSFQGTGDVSWPSLEEIAKRSSLTVQASSEAITGLVKKGFVTRKRNYGKPNTYRVLTATIEPENDYPEKADNQGNYVNQEKSGDEHRENPGDGCLEKSDDIVKEHIKTTKEKNIPAHIQSLRVEEKKDPYFPTATIEETDMVLNIIQEHLDKHYKRVAVKKDQRRWATEIVENLRDDDKEKQLRYMLNVYTFGEGSDKNKYWLDTTPQPKILYKAWDSLVNLRIPIWFERGFTSQAEYEADIIKTQPSSHSGMDDLKRQFFSGPMVSQERADQFMIEMDELKEKINGKT